MDVEIRHFHFFCGLGGGAKGFNRGEARVGKMKAKFRCLGGIDVDRAAAKDFEKMAEAPCTVMDLFSRDQYRAFNGKEPPEGWVEATPADIRTAAQNEAPHIIFLSAPCKGFSGLLAEKMSRTAKYQALNELTLRGVWLMLEAWQMDPPELIVFENVPRIATRGRFLLDQIVGLMRQYGYMVAETTHDCGELGGLAQSRKRFLLVARHAEKVPPFLYEPQKKPLLGVGDVLEKLPMPGDPLAGPMHRLPSLQWKTWLRLAFVEAGNDWRSLERLRVADGVLADYSIIPESSWRDGSLGVLPWDEAAGTVTARAESTTGRFNVADPRVELHREGRGHLGVKDWDETVGTISADARPSKGGYAVADPRAPEGALQYRQYGVKRWDEVGATVTGQRSPGQGFFSVEDPRPADMTSYRCFRIVERSSNAGDVTDPRKADGRKGQGKYHVTKWDGPSRTVIGASTTGEGGFAVSDPRLNEKQRGHHLHVNDWEETTGAISSRGQVTTGKYAIADPRPDFVKQGRDVYITGGHYGVVPWDQPAYAVNGSCKHDNGYNSVADPRLLEGEPKIEMPAAEEQLVAVIRSLDGTWHRPFSTLELASLQGLIDPEEHLLLEGSSDTSWRERIGNAVPPPAAQAIASVMGRTLLLAWSGETFMLSSEPIWVRPIATALSVDQNRQFLNEKKSCD